MAKYRQVFVDFWQDGFVIDLTVEEKYFFLYLLTNAKTRQCGIYELPKKVIESETGFSREKVSKLIERFVSYGKIIYSEETKEILIINWLKYNMINSPKVISCIEKELKEVKDNNLLRIFLSTSEQYGYRLNTLSKDYKEEEEKQLEKEVIKEQQEQQENIPFVEIINYLNHLANKKFNPITSRNQTIITARWKEGYRLNDFKKVIEIKCKQWLNNKDMKKYLRPETLFSPKFEGYLNEGEDDFNEANQYDDAF